MQFCLKPSQIICTSKLSAVCFWIKIIKEWAKVCPSLGRLWSVKRLDDSYPQNPKLTITEFA